MNQKLDDWKYRDKKNFKAQFFHWNTTIIFRAQQSFARHNKLLQNTTIISKTQRSIAIHKRKQNKVSRNTTTTTNKQSNEFASGNSSYLQMVENRLFGGFYVQQLTQ